MPVAMQYKNQMLDALPGTVYVAFFNGGAPGVGTEIAPATLWGAGDRPACVLEAAVNGVRTPDGNTALGTVALASQAVTHMAYYSAATGGNIVGHGPYARTFQQDMEVYLREDAVVFNLTDPA